MLSVLLGIYIIISKNPVISILYLIGLLTSIACYLIVIGISFIGLSYVLIYIGAVSILFIFILMLINIRISELLSNNINSIPLVTFIAILLNSTLYNILPYNNIIFSLLNNNLDKNYSLFNLNLNINNTISFISSIN